MDIVLQPDFDHETDAYPSPTVTYTEFESWTLCTITAGPHTIKLFLPLGSRL